MTPHCRRNACDARHSKCISARVAGVAPTVRCHCFGKCPFAQLVGRARVRGVVRLRMRAAADR
eukprot:651374-Lingulodinium_polyedra.AAC.1